MFKWLLDDFKAPKQSQPSPDQLTLAALRGRAGSRHTRNMSRQTGSSSDTYTESQQYSEPSNQQAYPQPAAQPRHASQPLSVLNGRKATDFRVQPAMIRHLRKQIQLRYTLDMQIWNRGRKARTFARDPTIAKMHRSDAVLRDIKTMLQDWDNEAFFDDQASYDTFRDIKRRIGEAKTRDWAKYPPWQGHAQEQVNGYGHGGGAVDRGVNRYGYAVGGWDGVSEHRYA